MSPALRHALIAYNGSTLLFSIMFATGKILSSHMGVFEITFFRCFLALVPFLGAAVMQKDKSFLRVRQPIYLFLRCFFGVMAMALTFFSYHLLPMPTATTLIFTGALWIIPLSALLLKEKVAGRRILVAFMGFLGVVVMIRPEQGALYGTSIALICAFFQGLVMIILHQLGKTERPLMIVLSFMALGTVLSGVGVAATGGFHMITKDIPMLAVLGVCGAVGQYLLSMAYRDAQPSFLGPYQYVSLIWSAILGYVLWSEHMDLAGWVGAALIIGSNIYLAAAEHQKNRIKVKQPVA